MRCLTLFVLVVLLGLTCFNSLQIRRINLELAQMKANSQAKADNPAEGELDFTTAIKLAGEYSDRAGKLIEKGQIEAARLELDKSLRKLETAARLSKGLAAGSSERLKSSWQAVQKQVEKAMEELSNQIEKERREGNETASGEDNSTVGRGNNKRTVGGMFSKGTGVDKR